MSSRLQVTMDRSTAIPTAHIAALYAMLIGSNPTDPLASGELEALGIRGRWMGPNDTIWRGYDGPHRYEITAQRVSTFEVGNAPGICFPRLDCLRVHRVDDVIRIPLPPELWRRTGKWCRCDYCLRADDSFWDVLALSAQPRDGGDATWTLHAPEYQRRSDRILRVTTEWGAPIDPKQMGELWQVFPCSHPRDKFASALLSTFDPAGSWTDLPKACWTAHEKQSGSEITVEILAFREPTIVPPPLSEIRIHRAEGNIYIPLPQDLWRPMEPTPRDRQGRYLDTSKMWDTLVVSAQAPADAVLDITWLAHCGWDTGRGRPPARGIRLYA